MYCGGRPPTYSLLTLIRHSGLVLLFSVPAAIVCDSVTLIFIHSLIDSFSSTHSVCVSSEDVAETFRWNAM